MASVQGVGVFAGLNGRPVGLLTGMALAMRANLTSQRKRGRCRVWQAGNETGNMDKGERFHQGAADEEATAVHEAGHTVIALALGIPVGKVSIERGSSYREH
jgi:hypothetical protein